MAGSRRYEKMLMQPFYPGGHTFDFGDRNSREKNQLPSLTLQETKKLMDEGDANKAQDNKQAWDRYFAGRGPKPDA